MGLKALYLKEPEEIGQLSSSSIPSMAWWSSFGSLSIHDGCKSLNNQTATNLQTSLPEYHAQIVSGFSQPMVPKVFSTYVSQVPGRIMLPVATDDGPIFVNPKQYHGIMRRRKSRAKAVLENRQTKTRKPFMHLSRHLHAMRRPRGTGGRFLNTKNSNNGPTGSRSSEVLVSSNSGSLKSSKEGNDGGSHVTGTEVTSNVYSRGDLEHFSISHLGPPGRLGHFWINHLV